VLITAGSTPDGAPDPGACSSRACSTLATPPHPRQRDLPEGRRGRRRSRWTPRRPERSRAPTAAWAMTNQTVPGPTSPRSESTLSADSFARDSRVRSAARSSRLALPKVRDRDERRTLPLPWRRSACRPAFDDRADFSGITTAEQLEISDVIQPGQQFERRREGNGRPPPGHPPVVMRRGRPCRPSR